MNINYVHSENGTYISLKSISAAVSITANTLKGFLYDIDCGGVIRTDDDVYLSECCACELLDRAADFFPGRVERFHRWMHSSFERLGDDAAEMEPTDDEEESVEDLLREIISLLAK